MKLRLTFVSLVAVSCSYGKEPPQQIPVTSQNSLGVVELEVEHSAGPDGKVFELVAYTANYAEVGRVRLHVGTIDDLPDLLPTTNTFGSEIVVSSGTAHDRLVSGETGLFQLGLDTDPGLRPLLEIGEVATTLQSEANIFVGPLPGDEAAYLCTRPASSCPANILLTSPIADQCCKTYDSCQGTTTTFKRNTDNLVIKRNTNVNGTPCIGTASNTLAPCDPVAGCYFGPLGFSRPTVVTGTASDNIYAYTLGHGVYSCQYDTTHSPTYGNVTGTQPRNQGCPGSAPGYGTYDY